VTEQPQLKPALGDTDHVQGDDSAKVTLVEFGDYQCSHCGRAYPIIKGLQDRFGSSLRFAFRNFPLSGVHPDARAAAEIAEAAAEQDLFWPMHDILFENQGALGRGELFSYAGQIGADLQRLKAALKTEAPANKVRADISSGAHSGVNGTPTFFINGVRFGGDWNDESQFLSALEMARG